MEYFLIILSTVLFGGQFIALNAYQDRNGKSYKSIFLFCALFSFVVAFVFLALNGFSLGFSIKTLLFSLLAAVLQILLQVAGIKALSMGSVGTYTLFNVAGSMSVAYIFGITYFNEPVKSLHLVGLFLIIFCLLIPIIFDRKNEKKSSWVFYLLCVGVFLANGFFGSVNKIHISLPDVLSIKEYMVYIYLWMFLISSVSFGICSIFIKGNNKELFKGSVVLFAVLYGLLNGFGMFLQYSNADKIPASILFPLSNGGCIVFSLIIGCIAYRRKPKLQDIVQLIIATGGMVLFIL